MKKLLSFTMMATLLGTSLYSQDFTEGNLVLLRIPHDETTSGGGETTNGNGALPMFLDEWDPNCISCGVKKTVALPTEETTISGKLNYRVVGNGSSGATHHISRSVDGRYLVVQGYSIPTGTNVHYTNATYDNIKPSFALVDHAGNINSTTRFTNAFTTGWMRAAVSYDGTGIWFGNASSAGGIHYLTVGSEANTTRIGGDYAWTAHLDGKKVLMGYNGSIRRIGPAVDLPKTTGQTVQAFTLSPDATDNNAKPSAVGMIALTNKAGQKVIYICDGNGTGSSPGIKKYLVNEAANTITFKGYIPISALPLGGGVSSIVGKVLYETDGTTFKSIELFTIGSGTNITNDAGRLVKIVDLAKFDETINATSSLLKNFKDEEIGGKKYFVRSLAWAPVENSTLPIKLESFKASQSTRGIELRWTTASEINNAYFEILKSIDGENFEVVGTVKGSGTTSAMHSYSFTDVNVSEGLYYYQLRQVDIDGKSETNSPIPVRFSVQTQDFKAWLAVNNQVNIKLTAKKVQKTQVIVSDILGRILIKKEVYITEGPNQFTLDLSKHKSPFIINISIDEKVFTEKLL
ncbi:hypothetical protein [Pseudopedobacter beijingensis]|uniref:Uncharacterized protein n=1 Tax=Pseudopedobacter beijingensis TaxID=1207056 RepID=A0ABW4IDJ5_9SPHI